MAFIPFLFVSIIHLILARDGELFWVLSRQCEKDLQAGVGLPPTPQSQAGPWVSSSVSIWEQMRQGGR